ncbi:hypothetical protein VTK26DRAFT_6641 [Humicola hyalothermophila]
MYLAPLRAWGRYGNSCNTEFLRESYQRSVDNLGFGDELRFCVILLSLRSWDCGCGDGTTHHDSAMVAFSGPWSASHPPARRDGRCGPAVIPPEPTRRSRWASSLPNPDC